MRIGLPAAAVLGAAATAGFLLSRAAGEADGGGPELSLVLQPGHLEGAWCVRF
jgi:hypothetical protein